MNSINRQCLTQFMSLQLVVRCLLNKSKRLLKGGSKKCVCFALPGLVKLKLNIMFLEDFLWGFFQQLIL